VTTLGRSTVAEIPPAALDEEPEDERNFTDGGERPDPGRVTWHQYENKPFNEVSEPRDHEQDAEDFRHETGSISKVADQQQMDAEQGRPLGGRTDRWSCTIRISSTRGSRPSSTKRGTPPSEITVRHVFDGYIPE
jgi:hypothetical protein